jgi:hypothetical protein
MERKLSILTNRVLSFHRALFGKGEERNKRRMGNGGMERLRNQAACGLGVQKMVVRTPEKVKGKKIEIIKEN